MTARDKVLLLEEVDASLYEGIDLDRLVVYAVAKLSGIQQDLSLENIIVASFKLFPKKFSLLGYGEYPDATRVEKSLWRSKGRKRGWVGGMTAHGYSLTEKGRLIASRVNELLLTGGVHGKKVTSQTRRKEAIIGEVTSSRAYQKYAQRRAESISDAEVCFVLQGTMDSLPETLRENLTSLKSIADELERKDLMKFLEYIEKRFSRFLGLR